jgi:hypothetical protein
MSGKPLTPEERAAVVVPCDCGAESAMVPPSLPVSEHDAFCNLRLVAAAITDAERRGHASGLREGAEIAESHGRRVAAAASVMRARAEEVERGE